MKLQAIALSAILSLSPVATSESVLPEGYNEEQQILDLMLADEALTRVCTFACASSNAKFGGPALLDTVQKNIQCACNRSGEPDKEAAK